VLAAGAVLRVLAAFPSFRHPVQSDSTMTGLTAFEILRGDLQVFLFDGTRLGALESYLHLPFFALFGASRATLHVAPVLAGVALLAAFAVLARELLGPEEGLLALLLLAVPSPVVLLWNILPFGYAETLFLIAAVLACAVRIARRGPEPLTVVGFGLAAGLGWWGSALSLAGTLPAALWIVLHRPALVRSRRFLVLAAGGLVAGALPWLAINVKYPLISFQGGPAWKGNFAFHPVGGLAQLLDNAGRFAGEILPGLLLRAECPRLGALGPVVLLVGALHAAALLLALVEIASPRLWKGAGEGGARRVPPLLLPLLVTACNGAFFTVSAAGSIPGDVVRYIVPIGLAAPLVLAHLAGRVAARSREAAVVFLLIVLVGNASGYCLPWSPDRLGQRRLARAEDRLLDLLAARRVRWVFGPYWDVYGLNFLSGETIRAIPETAANDYHSYGRKLGSTPVPFALISREPGEATDLARHAGLSGATVDLDGAFEVFLASPPPVPPAKQLVRLRKALIPDPLPPEAMPSRIERLDGGGRLRLGSGDRWKLPVRLTHLGRGANWTSGLGRSGENAVRLGVLWFRDGVVVADGRTELPHTLHPGESAELDVDLQARGNDGQPLPPGTYEVQIELVQELVLWFKDAGDEPARLTVEVE